ncbi:MAG: ABC transporter permease, partial [Pseudoclavibacter sp.]
MTVLRQIGRYLQNPQVAVALLCLICFVGPAAMIVQGAFQTEMFGDGGEFTIGAFVEVITSSRVHSVAITTVGMGVAVIVISTVIALFFTAIYAKTRTPLRAAIPVVMFVLVATPGLFFAIAWGLLGNPNIGLVNEGLAALFGEGARVVNAESWWGIVLVSAIKLIGLQFFLLLGPFLALDKSLEESARMSGAGPLRTFFQMEIPILAPAITGAMILGFVLFLESFDAPQILGVPAGIFVVPTEIYQFLSASTGPRYGHASSMSILLMVILLLLVFVQMRVLGRRSYVTVGGKESRALRRDVGPWKWPFTALFVVFAILTVVLPMYQLILVSLSPFLGATGNYSLANFESVVNNDRMMQALGNSLVVAALGALLAMTASIGLTWAARFKSGVLSRFIDFSQWLGLAMPGLILALGVLWFFLKVPGLSTFYGTPIIMIFAMFIAVIPLAGRTTSAAMAQIPKSLEEAAWVSGASKYR